jgi:hypothetical protein
MHDIFKVKSGAVKMGHGLWAGLAGLALWLVVVPAQAQTTPPPSREAGTLDRALSDADAGRWDSALSLAAQAGPIAERLVLWTALRAGEGGYFRLLWKQNSTLGACFVPHARAVGAVATNQTAQRVRSP